MVVALLKLVCSKEQEEETVCLRFRHRHLGREHDEDETTSTTKDERPKLTSLTAPDDHVRFRERTT